MAEIYIEDAKKILNLWKKAPKMTEQVLKKTLQKSLLRLEATSVKEAPVDSGHLRMAITNSIHNLVGSVHTSDGGEEVKYLKFVHNGRGAIYAKAGKVLAVKATDVSPRTRAKFRHRISKKGFIIFGKKVKAQKANPFFDKSAKKEK